MKGDDNVNRAELRRMKREEGKRTKTYVMTAEDIENIRRQEREKAKEKYLKKIDETSADILLMMLAIPVNVLINDYWKKTSEKRIPKFIEDCMSLYESFESGAITMSEMTEVVERFSKVKLLKGATEKTVRKGY